MSNLAMYIRLSVDEKMSDKESESISNLRAYLRDFIAKNKDLQVMRS